MHFGIVRVTVREVDLAGVYTERDHGCVVNHVPGINDSDQWTIMCVPDGSWRRKLRWKFSTGRSRNNLPVRRKIHRACIANDIPFSIQVSRSSSQSGELKLSGEVQS